MRILHAPINSAGQATVISRAQRKMGHTSDVLVFTQNNFSYPVDINLDIVGKPLFIREWIKFWTFWRVLGKYDVFHFHSAVTFLPKYFDIKIIRLLGKKVIMEYWGSDIVQLDLAREYTLWTEEELKSVYSDVDDEAQRKKIAILDKICNKTIAGSPALRPFSPKSEYSYPGVNLENKNYIGAKPKASGEVTIVHAPTNRKIKGTDDILETLDKLKSEGYNFNLVLVEGLTNEEANAIYQKADLVIDEIRQGPYGTLAIECMAYGKPVICWRSPKFDEFYKNCPVISADKNTLFKKVEELLKNPSLREELGKKSRQYVEEVHDAKKIAEKLIKIYAQN